MAYTGKMKSVKSGTFVSATGIALTTLPARPEPHHRATVACATLSIIGNRAFSFTNLQSAREKPLALILSAKVILSWERVVTIVAMSFII